MGLFTSDWSSCHSQQAALSSWHVRGKEIIKYKLREQAVEAQPPPSMSYPLPLTQLKEPTSPLYQFGANAPAVLREKMLVFCQFIPLRQFVPGENHFSIVVQSSKWEDPPSFLFPIFRDCV